MKCKKTINLNLGKTNETIGFFGRAKLVRSPDGRHELLGGTQVEQATVRNWCQHFAPEIVIGDQQDEFDLGDLGDQAE